MLKYIDLQRGRLQSLDLSVSGLFKNSFSKNSDCLALCVLPVLLHFASVPNVRACLTTNLFMVALTGPKVNEASKAADTDVIIKLYLRVKPCSLGETHTNKGVKRYSCSLIFLLLLTLGYLDIIAL